MWKSKITILLGICFLCVGAYELNACQLKSGWEPWPPFQFENDEGELTGLDIELLKIVSDRINCSISFLKIRWVAHLDRLKHGVLDIAASASRTEERDKYAYYSVPYRLEVVKLYLREGESKRFQIENLTDIVRLNFMLGVTEGYYYGDEFERLLNQNQFKRQVEYVEDNLHNFHKLVAGRIDGFLMDSVAAKKLMEQLSPSYKIEHHPLEVYSNNIFFLLSRQSVSAQTVARFNKALSEIKKEEIYDKIFEKYNIIEKPVEE